VKRRGDPRVDADRLHNMQRAIDHLHGVVLAPGQVLSFWHHVPRPSRRNGYRAGPMLVAGRLRSEVGGGLCQVSTTLFGALLEAGCTLLEHSNHSVDVHGGERFFRLGQDAAVAYGFKNLLASNDHGVPLQLELRLEGDEASLRLRAALLAPIACPRRYRIESQLLDTPPSVPEAATAAGGPAGTLVETRRWAAPAAVSPHEADGGGWRLDYRFLSRYRPASSAPADPAAADPHDRRRTA
jgi:vancomycin resistance protein VanW